MKIFQNDTLCNIATVRLPILMSLNLNEVQLKTVILYTYLKIYAHSYIYLYNINGYICTYAYIHTCVHKLACVYPQLLANAACSERVAEQLERIKLAFCFSKLLANHLSP